MSNKFKILLAACVALYGAENYFIGIRIWQHVGSIAPFSGNIYWTVFCFLAASYAIGRLVTMYFPGKAGDYLTIIGCYWLAAFFYALLLLTLLEGIYILDRWLDFLPEGLKPYHPIPGLLVILLVFIIVVYGVWNASQIVIRRYTLNVPKTVNGLDRLRIIVAADLHLGLIIGKKRLRKLIEIIDKLQPDLILFPGDILDETVGVFVESEMPAEFRKLKSRFGMYGILGNHEYIWGGADKAIQYIEQAGIPVLRDQCILVQEKFYLIGRDDVIRKRFANPRMDLADIVQNTDQSLPCILMDHTPEKLKTGPELGIDLQIFGHTHHGQFFPINLITQKMFDLDYGYSHIKNCHTIVSAGFGTFGPPIRIGSKPEIVEILLTFGNQAF